MTKTDYHIHTELCGHAKGTPEEYIKAALQKGFIDIGIADHAPAPPQYDPKHRMSRDQFDDYVRDIERLQKEHKEIKIRLGIETDYYPGFEDYLYKLRKTYPIEYAIGSVHFINGNPIFHSDVIDCHPDQAEKMISEYFDGFRQLVKSGNIDIIGHFDLIKWVLPQSTQRINDLGKALLSTFLETGIILEINTSGLRKQPKEFYPSPDILNHAFRLGFPICLNSDAHQPNDVGRDFDQVEPVIESLGAFTVTTQSGLQVMKRVEKS